MQGQVRRRELVAFMFMAATAAACTAIDGRQTAGQYVDDASITAKVKTAIIGEPTLSANQIGVETFNGTVQLSGFVDETGKAAKAAQLASQVDGVKAVRNDLVIR